MTGEARGRLSTPLCRLGRTELRRSLSRGGRPDSVLETTAGDW